MQGFKSGSSDGLSKYYADDAVMLPPSSEILSNKKQIVDYWQNLKTVGFEELSIYLVDVEDKGQQVVSTALWQITRKSVDGYKVIMKGNISNVLEKQLDQSWKIILQSWN